MRSERLAILSPSRPEIGIGRKSLMPMLVGEGAVIGDDGLVPAWS